MRLLWRNCVSCICVSGVAASAAAQPPLTWADVRDRFRAVNATLQAGQIGVDESKAAETTAYLRPNPQWAVTLDQVGNAQSGGPLSAANLLTSVSYLREREGKDTARARRARCCLPGSRH